MLGHLVYLVEGYQASEAGQHADRVGSSAQDQEAGGAAPYGAAPYGAAGQAGRRGLSARLAGRLHEGFFVRAREIGRAPGPELVERLRSAAASRYNGLPSVALSEVLIHGDDMLQPLGLRAGARPEEAVAALDLMRWVSRLAPGIAFQGRPRRDVRLVADDVEWSSGRGPEARGPALDILAVLANRRGAEAGLTGPGVARLQVGAGS